MCFAQLGIFDGIPIIPFVLEHGRKAYGTIKDIHDIFF